MKNLIDWVSARIDSLNKQKIDDRFKDVVNEIFVMELFYKFPSSKTSYYDILEATNRAPKYFLLHENRHVAEESEDVLNPDSVNLLLTRIKQALRSFQETGESKYINSFLSLVNNAVSPKKSLKYYSLLFSSLQIIADEMMVQKNDLDKQKKLVFLAWGVVCEKANGVHPEIYKTFGKIADRRFY